MKEFLSEMVSALLKTSPFLIACLAVALPNLKRRERAHQFTMPILAVIYCIPILLFTRRMGELLETFLTYLIGVFTLLPVVGRSLNNWLTSLANTINNSVNTELLYNISIAVVFLIIKAVARPIARRSWKRHRILCKHVAAFFYWQWNEKSVLMQRFGDMRRMLKAFYIAFLLLGWLNCALVLYGLTNTIFALPQYPVFAILILGEVFFYLNGKTPDEWGFVDGSDPEEKEVECGEILSGLLRTFGDRVGYSDQRPEPARQNNRMEWEEMLENGDNLDQITCSYFRNLSGEVPEIETDYVIAACKLLHKKSVLIYNPFYHDMTDYILLPIFNALLNHRSCLIICGRNTNEQDIREWIKDGMTQVTNLPNLWNIEVLDGVPNDNEPAHIGILGFERIFDMNNLRENQDFFHKTSLVIMLEPSNLLGTGQIGLRSVLQFCENGDEKPVYCILDRNADGLVDALSHAVRQSITEVVASPSQKSGYCRAFWRAEGPGMQTRVIRNLSHYMGIGGEISTFAMHEGAKVMHWYSGDKMPLTDLKWNVEQYVGPISRYLSIPGTQLELDNRFHYHENLWQAAFGPRTFVLVEDEFCNAFEMERAFGARIRQKGFVNILSESYMLRDYMYDNHDLFTNDPKAIPSIVPDYARTERNLVLRILMLMAIQPMEASVLSQELALHGIETKNAKNTFAALVRQHTDIQSPKIRTRQSGQGKMGVAGYTRYAYSVDQTYVDHIFDSALRIAYFVIENEQTKTYMMGNRLMDHVEQIILPGQFFCYEGKYYQVRKLSRDTGIVVRRAADHLNGRIYYRQLRHYRLESQNSNTQVQDDRVSMLQDGSDEVKNVRGIKLRKVCSDVTVKTDGYLEMMVRNDLPNADYVELDSDNTSIRRLRNKELLCVELPDATPEIRFALCLLLNELFQTVYPNDCSYITAVMQDVPDCVVQNEDYAQKIASVVYTADIENALENCIYIIEDSNIDLGLLVSFERNFQRFMEIIADYLDWYLNPERKHAGSEDPEENVDESGPSDEPEKIDENDDDTAENAEDADNVEAVENAEDAENAEAVIDAESGEAENTAAGSSTEMLMPDSTLTVAAEDRDNDDVDGEDEELLDNSKRAKKKAYQSFEYLTFGYDGSESAEWLAAQETLQYLTGKNFLNSNLHRSHYVDDSFDSDSDYDPNTPGTHYCDFCGAPMEPNSYDVLKDGRERCACCSKDAIKTRKQFKKVYSETIEEMQNIFEITFDESLSLKIRMANARKVNEGNVDYQPSPRADGRVLGYAQGNTILVENGAPRWKMKQTLVHELTHIWQFNNWDKNYQSRYGSDDQVTMTMEGMAVWTEIQYLLAMGEKERAVMYKRNRDCDPSVYGVGMKKYLDKYPPKELKTIPKKKSPFGKFPPI